MLPCFVAAPFLTQSFSIVFTVSWASGTGLFFCIWFWATGAYLADPERFRLEIDEFGIRERLLASEEFWSWRDIDEIEMHPLDGSKVIVLLLKEKSWKRRLRLFGFDAMLSNQYAVSQEEILAHLLDQQKCSTQKLASNS